MKRRSYADCNARVFFLATRRAGFTKVVIRTDDPRRPFSIRMVPKGYERNHAEVLEEQGAHIDRFNQHVIDWIENP